MNCFGKHSLILFAFFVSLIINRGYSQVSFEKFPKDNQVFQRNDQNQSNLNIKGRVNESNHSSVSLVILKDNINFFQQSISLANSKDFSFNAPIIAGNFDYTIQFLLDNREIKKVEKVACGDVFLIYGQSNAMGGHGIANYFPPPNPFIRSFVTFDFEYPRGEWVLPYTTFFWPSAGALELSNFLSEKHKYPIGFIEASVGGAGIGELNANPNNPFDRNTPYGKMLISADINNLRTDLKYLIFRHGETDGSYSSTSLSYPAEFEKLYNNLNTHFPNVKTLYNLQVDILTEPNPNAGFLRDFQRRTKSLYSKVSTMATVGTVGHDGLHYSLAGYRQTALELSRIMGKEIYNDGASPQVYSPEIKKILWQNSKLVLEFDEGMQMNYPNDILINDKLWRMKDYIFINGQNNLVVSGESTGNKIILTLLDGVEPLNVSYLPNYYGIYGVDLYKDLHLKNALGMRAFSFNNVIVEIPQIPINLSFSVMNDAKVVLSWNINDNFRIERSTDNINFNTIASVSGTNYIDNSSEVEQKYYYRLVSIESSGRMSNIIEVSLKCLEDYNLRILSPIVSFIGVQSTITATVKIPQSKQLSLEANKSINLEPGFDAELGSIFSAEIGGCKNN